MCRLTEGVLKQFGFQKAEHHSMICHDWLGTLSNKMSVIKIFGHRKKIIYKLNIILQIFLTIFDIFGIDSLI